MNETIKESTAPVYRDISLCDETVARFAQCGATIDEIADMFGISSHYVRTRHSPAFKAGKALMKVKPRTVLFQLIDELEQQVKNNIAEIGEFALDDEGNEIRRSLDKTLVRTLLEAIAQADKYLPKEMTVQVQNPYAGLTDNELVQRLVSTARKGNLP